MPIEAYESAGGGLQVGGTGESTFFITISIDFNWVTNSYAVIEQKFYWDIGATRLKWYRITGRCEYITNLPETQDANDVPIPDPSGRTVTKATAPIYFNDPSCDGLNQKHFYLQTVLARSPWEVCNKLKENNLIWKILTMQEHGCPANLEEKLPEEDCNALIDVEFCGFPECEEFCVDFLAYVKIGVSSSIQDQEIAVASGNIYKFSSETDEECPSLGYLSINQPLANLENTTKVYISNFDFAGNDQTAWYETFNNSIGPIKGEIVFFDLSGNEILVFHITAPVSEEGIGDCYNIPVKQIGGDSLPSPDQDIIVSFSPEYRLPKDLVPETDLDVIEPTFRTVRPSCASLFVDQSCMNIPFKLYCYHNLAEDNTLFSSFLKRNAFNIEPAVGMQYSSNRDAWSGTMFYVGAGDGSDNFIERWKFVFEWSCLPINQAFGLLTGDYSESIIYGNDLSALPSPSYIGFRDDVFVAVWFFRLWAQRKKINLQNSQETNYNSFFYAIFHAGILCSFYKDGLLDFNFDLGYNSSEELKMKQNEYTYDYNFIDSIGLFPKKSSRITEPYPFPMKISWLEPQLPGDFWDISSLLG